MVPSRCARHELVVLFLQVFEAGTALDWLKPFKQSDQESIAPYIRVRGAFHPACEIFTRRTTGLGKIQNHQA
jgi:hypothetical protein